MDLDRSLYDNCSYLFVTDVSKIVIAKVNESKRNFSSRLNKTVQLISETAGKNFHGKVQDVSKLMNFRASPAEMIGRKSFNNIIPAEGQSTNKGNDNHNFFTNNTLMI